MPVVISVVVVDDAVVVVGLVVVAVTAADVVVVVANRAAKTAKVLKWLTEAVIVSLTISILTVVSCSHCPVVGLYQATYGVAPFNRLGLKDKVIVMALLKVVPVGSMS